MGLQQDPRLTAADTAIVLLGAQTARMGRLPEEVDTEVRRCIAELLGFARIAGISVLATEEDRDAAGPMDPSVAEALERLGALAHRVTLVAPDATVDDDFDAHLEHLASRGMDEGVVRNLLVAGFDAHVAVVQTVRSLTTAGFHVHVPLDAIGAATAAQRDAARHLLARTGATLTSTETALFELAGPAGTDRHGGLMILLGR
jgi:nicotinamidase-related amidase